MRFVCVTVTCPQTDISDLATKIHNHVSPVATTARATSERSIVTRAELLDCGKWGVEAQI